MPALPTRRWCWSSRWTCPHCPASARARSACRTPARSAPRRCWMRSPASACWMPAPRRAARAATCSSGLRHRRAGRAGCGCRAAGTRGRQPAAAGARRDLQQADLLADSWWDGRPFDRILLDAPCSGTGVIRRHPDIKLLRRPGDIDKFAATQRKMLMKCAGMLKPGGRLVYATCSILQDENQAGYGRVPALDPRFTRSQPDLALLPTPASAGPVRAHRRLLLCLPAEGGSMRVRLALESPPASVAGRAADAGGAMRGWRGPRRLTTAWQCRRPTSTCAAACSSSMRAPSIRSTTTSAPRLPMASPSTSNCRPRSTGSDASGSIRRWST